MARVAMGTDIASIAKADMCGRFTLALTSDELRDHFKAQNAVDIDPQYNIEPTQNISDCL